MKNRQFDSLVWGSLTLAPIIGIMRLSYNERAVPDGRFRHHLFQAVFIRTTYPSRYVYFGWSRVHTAVETAVTTPVGM